MKLWPKKDENDPLEAAACQMNPLVVNLQEEIKDFYIRSPPVVVNFCRGECIDYSSFCKTPIDHFLRMKFLDENKMLRSNLKSSILNFRDKLTGPVSCWIRIRNFSKKKYSRSEFKSLKAIRRNYTPWML